MVLFRRGERVGSIAASIWHLDNSFFHVVLVGEPEPNFRETFCMGANSLERMGVAPALFKAGEVVQLVGGGEVEVVYNQDEGHLQVLVVNPRGGPSRWVWAVDLRRLDKPTPCICPLDNFMWNGIGCQCGGA